MRKPRTVTYESMHGRRFRLRVRGFIALTVCIALVGAMIDVARVLGGDLQSSPDGAWLMEGKPDTINVFVARALFKKNGAWATVKYGRFISWKWIGPGEIGAVVSKGSIVQSWTDKNQGLKFKVTER